MARLKSVTSLRNAAIASILIGSIIFYLYHRPYPVLGLIVGASLGIATFMLLRLGKIYPIRLSLLIAFSTFAWGGFFVFLFYTGLGDIIKWTKAHVPLYYTDMYVSGSTYVPCNRNLPELILGIASFGEFGAFVHWPHSVGLALLVILPYILTAVILGRGFCGWICFYGGIVELFSVGKKERWKFTRIREKISHRKGNIPIYGGLKEEIKDIKYGIAFTLVLFAIAFAVPLVCIVCWYWLVEFIWIGVAFIIATVIFAIILPFMTKRRWFCVLCPVGALINLVERLSPFEIKIDRSKCVKDYSCLHECPTYALTQESIDESNTPNIDCIKCYRCAEGCPTGAIDMYVRNSILKAGTWFIPLVILAAAAWYLFFVLTILQLTPSLFFI
jgi:NAD-dependent dihydropyrimidine dehydrogenase PreA subunit